VFLRLIHVLQIVLGSMMPCHSTSWILKRHQGAEMIIKLLQLLAPIANILWLCHYCFHHKYWSAYLQLCSCIWVMTNGSFCKSIAVELVTKHCVAVFTCSRLCTKDAHGCASLRALSDHNLMSHILEGQSCFEVIRPCWQQVSCLKISFLKPQSVCKWD
jgi:hypothetical protein